MALLTYAVGAYLVVGHMGVAVAVGGAGAVLLQWKKPMHAFVAAVGDAAKEHFGSGGLYVVAVLDGLTDRDAITLSISQLATDERLDAGTGWRLILVASLANSFFKVGTVATMDNRSLLGLVGLVLDWPSRPGLLLLLL